MTRSSSGPKMENDCVGHPLLVPHLCSRLLNLTPLNYGGGRSTCSWQITQFHGYLWSCSGFRRVPCAVYVRFLYPCLGVNQYLTLRGRAGSNALTSVPPQIAQLTSLQELNLAQNKLRWLPAEMLSMRLTKLTVAGNPWIPPPLQDDSTRQPSQQASPQRQRPVSFTTIHYTIPPLVESCLRILLAPHHPDSSHSSPRPLTVLEASYALPLTEDLSIGPSVLATLRACVPAAVARPATAAQLAWPSKV